MVLGLFSNISSLDPCILLAPYYGSASSFIYNCSFENILANSPTSSCIEFYHSHSTFNYSCCSYRNITSLHPDGAGAIYLNMDGSNDVFTVSENQFIDISSKSSVFNMFKNSRFLVFEKTSFANISVEQNGGVCFYLIFFFRILLLILFLFSGNLL
jgi:hypothetical protein